MKNIVIPIIVMSSAIFLMSYMTVSNAYSISAVPTIDKNIKLSDLKSLKESSKITKSKTKCYNVVNGKFVEVPCPDVIIVTKVASRAG